MKVNPDYYGQKEKFDEKKKPVNKKRVDVDPFNPTGDRPDDYQDEPKEFKERPRDLVNSPEHYQGKGMEAIDVIEAFSLGFCLGNAIKYILRAGRKENRLFDLKKAAWYLNREIEEELEKITIQ